MFNLLLIIFFDNNDVPSFYSLLAKDNLKQGDLDFVVRAGNSSEPHLHFHSLKCRN